MENNYNNPYEEVTPEEQNKETNKGFNAYMEIYDSDELLTKVCAVFAGNADALSKKDISDIKTYLILKSGLPRSNISHTVFEILSLDDNSFSIDFFDDEDSDN